MPTCRLASLCGCHTSKATRWGSGWGCAAGLGCLGSDASTFGPPLHWSAASAAHGVSRRRVRNWLHTCAFGDFQNLPSIPSPPVTAQHMGLADVECVSGCTCAPATLNGRSDHRISVPFPLQFPASAAAGLLAAWPDVCRLACPLWLPQLFVPIVRPAAAGHCLPCHICCSGTVCSQLCTAPVRRAGYSA